MMWIIGGLLTSPFIALLWLKLNGSTWPLKLTDEACPKSWSWTQKHLYGYRKYGE